MNGNQLEIVVFILGHNVCIFLCQFDQGISGLHGIGDFLTVTGEYIAVFKL